MWNTGLRSLYQITAIVLLSLPTCRASSERLLFSFDGQHGAVPYGGLITDGAGDLFGTTAAGGLYGAGTVFELVPSGSGYNEFVLYNFTGGLDGSSPLGTLTRDSFGNLYGTTSSGGAHGAGTVFELDTGNIEHVIYSFQGGSDGRFPIAGVVFDASGTILYGTTEHGGTGTCADSNGSGCGTVFKVTLAGFETVLHRFSGHADGALPWAAVVFDGAGNIYSTTLQGGTGTCAGATTGCGTVFRLSTSGSETLLHRFTGHADGALPEAPLVFDLSGTTFYGTASAGGATACTGGCGVVFRLQTSGSGFALLHSFKNIDGAQPTAGLAYESAGSDLYGTTFAGGLHHLGVVFEVTTGGGTGYTDLHDFSGGSNDGANPFAGLLLTSPANKIGPPTKGGCPPTCAGTTTGGGLNSAGTVFAVSN